MIFVFKLEKDDNDFTTKLWNINLFFFECPICQINFWECVCLNSSMNTHAGSYATSWAEIQYQNISFLCENIFENQAVMKIAMPASATLN